MNKQLLITELQSHGLKLLNPGIGAAGRRGGAGSSDHKAVTVEGTTVMVPIFTSSAAQSPYTARVNPGKEQAILERAGEAIALIGFPQQPKFYSLSTADGIPFVRPVSHRTSEELYDSWEVEANRPGIWLHGNRGLYL